MGGSGSTLTEDQQNSANGFGDEGAEVQARPAGPKILYGLKLMEVAKQAELQQQVDARRLARRQERESYRFEYEDEDEDDDDEDEDDEDDEDEDDDVNVEDTRTRSSSLQQRTTSSSSSSSSSSQRRQQHLDSSLSPVSSSSLSVSQDEILRETPEQAVKAAENAFNSLVEDRHHTRSTIQKEVDSRFIRSEEEMIQLENSKLTEVLREVNQVEDILHYRFGF